MKKPQLSFWEIWNMSFGFLGIQFGFALQNANVSRIFENLGADISEISILWLAAPVTGLVVQPIIGYFSDRTWGKLGRRRPYFLLGAIMASIALVIMPNSPALWMAAGMLWIMDTSFNISMEPFRAFVGDNLPDEQRTQGFATQTFFIGVGAVVASLLPYILTNWFGVSNEAPEGVIPNSVKWSFYLGAAVFLMSIIWTVIKSNEYPPEVLASFTEDEPKQTFTAIDPKSNKLGMRGGFIGLVGIILTIWFYQKELPQDLYVLSVGLVVVGLLAIIASALRKNGNKSGFITMVNDITTMPKTMKQLAVVQFFSWFALFSMWIYTTAAVTGSIYGTTDSTSEAYNEGANWVGVCFAVYNGAAAVVAFLLPMLAKRIGRKQTHAFGLFMGALGLISIFFIRDPNMLLISMVGVGVAWASILSMPYAILTGALPSDKMGYYMGVFNFFIVIPQILAAALLGFLLKQFFEEQAIYAMLIGGFSYIIAALASFAVDDD